MTTEEEMKELEKAIAHCKEIENGSECESCKKEHKQLGEWLSELKRMKEDERMEVFDRLCRNKHKYSFRLHVEGNDNVCMYTSKEETVEFLAESDVDAYNMMIDSCLREGYSRFSVEYVTRT